MKKLMLLPMLLALLLLPSAASAADFDTPQYEELQTYVYDELLPLEGAVSDGERDVLFVSLELRANVAYWSIDLVKEKALDKIESDFRYNARELEFRAERKEQVAKQKVRAWYRKNKDLPGAKKKAERRILRATTKIRSDLKKDLEILDLRAMNEGERVDLMYQLQGERITSLFEKGFEHIKYLPGLS